MENLYKVYDKRIAEEYVPKPETKDIIEFVPLLSSTSIERNLNELCDSGEIKK